MQISSITLCRKVVSILQNFWFILRSLLFKWDDMGSSLLSCMDLLKWFKYQQSGCSYKIGLQIQIIAQTSMFGQGILDPLSKTVFEYGWVFQQEAAIIISKNIGH